MHTWRCQMSQRTDTQRQRPWQATCVIQAAAVASYRPFMQRTSRRKAWQFDAHLVLPYVVAPPRSTLAVPPPHPAADCQRLSAYACQVHAILRATAVWSIPTQASGLAGTGLEHGDGRRCLGWYQPRPTAWQGLGWSMALAGTAWVGTNPTAWQGLGWSWALAVLTMRMQQRDRGCPGCRNGPHWVFDCSASLTRSAAPPEGSNTNCLA